MKTTPPILLSCQSLSKEFPARPLFRNLSLSIFEGDRIGLIGLNGCGKSTLLKIIAGLETATSGTISTKQGTKIGYLPQSCEFEEKTAQEILVETLKQNRDVPEYERERIAQMWLEKLKFTSKDTPANLLSGGWKKRIGLAKELILSPDILLLDEPTNHLDLEGVLWLEKFLEKEKFSYLVVSHDRYFLQNVAHKIIEIDKVYPGGLFAIDGSYSHFLSKKEAFIEGQLQQERSIATKARREQEWLRSGVKARTTKSQARIDEAHDILSAHAEIQYRNKQTSAKISFSSTERETRKLISVKNVQKSIGTRELFSHLEFTLSPGSRLGLMGPNGCGKTTLLRLLSGELTPDAGTIKRAEGLHIVHFDQHRAQLPLHLSLKDALSPKGDYVEFRGQKIHVNGWCKRFLFSPDLLEMPISSLSGGERARIAIAHLMLQNADVLLLDEPTNDLDIPTLEAFEESLLEFPGAVVLITHDRCMMDRICNSLIALSAPHGVEIYSDYAQWEAALPKNESKIPSTKKEKPSQERFSSKEKNEYGAIEGKIEKLEEEVKQLNKLLETEEIASNPQKLARVCQEIGLAEVKIEQLYLRFEELDKKIRTQNSGT